MKSLFLKEHGRIAARTLVVLGLINLAVVGCGRNPNSLATLYAKDFATAPPEIKAAWDSATAAAKTNGYAPALLTFDALQKQTNLTPAQLEAVQQTADALRDHIYAAVKKNDPQALAALEELQQAYFMLREKGRR